MDKRQNSWAEDKDGLKRQWRKYHYC